MDAIIYVNKVCDCFQAPNFQYLKNELLKRGIKVQQKVDMSLKTQKVVYKDHVLEFNSLTLSSTILRWCNSLVG